MHKVFSKIRSVVAVVAGKGGVGKSSMTVNLAQALHAEGYAVGVLDADLYGPSLGHMMPLDAPLKKDLSSKTFFFPGECCGIKVFSLSHVRLNESSLSVRAPVVNELLLQCTRDILWGELDYLLVDFPPGTGDIQLTLLQNIPFAGAVLVTMPQEISVMDVKKAADMFHHVGIPILGVIENMTYFMETASQKKHYLFGQGGGEKIANLFGIPFLGEVPVDPSLCKSGDEGRNFLKDYKDCPAASIIRDIAAQIRSNLFILESMKGEYLRQFELIWEDKVSRC
ncbi:MAG: Mrp/NBP35 family ATP-binding protein [Chlamydiota bacterium]